MKKEKNIVEKIWDWWTKDETYHGSVIVFFVSFIALAIIPQETIPVFYIKLGLLIYLILGLICTEILYIFRPVKKENEWQEGESLFVHVTGIKLGYFFTVMTCFLPLAIFVPFVAIGLMGLIGYGIYVMFKNHFDILANIVIYSSGIIIIFYAYIKLNMLKYKNVKPIPIPKSYTHVKRKKVKKKKQTRKKNEV